MCSLGFTQLKKLGINPRSKYNTPIGIYSYPADYVVRTVGPTDSMIKLPFVGDAPFANIFSVKGNIIDIGMMHDGEVNQYYKKLKNIFDPKLVDQLITKSEQEANYSGFPGGRLWFVTMMLANRNPVKWNKIFRSIGIDGCIDGYGTSIIHPSEPTQAVFFSIKAIAHNTIIENKTPRSKSETDEIRKSNIEQNRDFKYYLDDVNNLSDFIEVCDRYGFEQYELVAGVNNSELKKQIIREFPHSIKFLSNPSGKIQTIAFTANPYSILDVPKNKLNMESVMLGLKQATSEYWDLRNATDLIKHIPINQQIYTIIVKNVPSAVTWIDNPSKRILQIAINNCKELPSLTTLRQARQFNIDLSHLRGKTNSELNRIKQVLIRRKEKILSQINDYKERNHDVQEMKKQLNIEQTKSDSNQANLSKMEQDLQSDIGNLSNLRTRIKDSIQQFKSEKHKLLDEYKV